MIHLIGGTVDESTLMLAVLGRKVSIGWRLSGYLEKEVLSEEYDHFNII